MVLSQLSGKKRKLKLYYVCFLLLNFWGIEKATATNTDSLFIEDCKSFFFKEIGFTLKGNFYTEWRKTDSPYLCLYISKDSDVVRPKEYNFTYDFVYCKNDSDFRRMLEKSNGYQTFLYKTYNTSSCMLSKRFMSYSNEAKAFIIFHELMHNYVFEKEANLLYEYNEAVSDVMGNYLALKFAKTTGKISVEKVLKQTKINENLYEWFNRYINKIHENPADRFTYHKECEARVNYFLKEADTFQHDRFQYKVNNAYLLKNSNYCKRYFVLKDLFLSKESTQEFLEAFHNFPDSKRIEVIRIYDFTKPNSRPTEPASDGK
ncbi:MAG: hypothetical protein NTX03_03615 [Bacteroidetes bacterium]|nr:hypothetical protein [Bacteroidota bacterium]